MTKKISDKDLKDWEIFTSSKDKLHIKDSSENEKSYDKTRSIDLHGYTLEGANQAISKFISDAYKDGVKKLIIVTGKGLHSQNEKNPYVSKDLSILKHAIPDFILNNKNLMQKIIEIKEAKIEDGGSGAFYIFLKKNGKV